MVFENPASVKEMTNMRYGWLIDKTHPFLKSLNKVKDEIISHMVIRWDHGAPIDCSSTIESMRSISSGIYDPHSLKSLASPHYLMGWYQGSNDQAWPNILLLGRISFLANDCSVDNGCQKIHNINAVQVEMVWAQWCVIFGCNHSDFLVNLVPKHLVCSF